MSKRIKLRQCPCCGEMVKKSHLRKTAPGITFRDKPVDVCKRCFKMSDEEHRVAFEKEFGTPRHC